MSASGDTSSRARASAPQTPAAALPPVDCPTGSFEHRFGTSTFVWSEETFLIHGYTRGEVVPTFELGMAHVNAEDRQKVLEHWRRINTEPGHHAGYFTLTDARGTSRRVLTVGTLVTDEDGRRTGVRGVVTDLTQAIHKDRHQLANEAVVRSAASRATLEQAKGVLMGRLGITADQAFAVISRQSQATHRKANLVAQGILDEATRQNTVGAPFDGDADAPDESRSVD